MIGALNERITLLTPVRSSDPGGGEAITWIPGVAIWAAVDRLASTQDFAGDRGDRLRRVAATIRTRNDIKLGVRFRFDASDFEIVSIEDGEGPQRLILIGEEASS